jgi:hypothetical protein
VRVRIRHEAGEGERFAPGVYDRQLGELIPFNDVGGTDVSATLTAATVADDGSYVVLDLDVPDGTDLQGMRSVVVDDD